MDETDEPRRPRNSEMQAPPGGHMDLSSAVAMNIINEMRPIISRDINIIDARGIIIASTDPQRIGQLHTAAKMLIEQKLEEIAIDDDTAYQGARQGINLPILFKDQVIGVIGITGDVDEVSKYGHILKKMTEILLMNQYILEQQSIEEKITDTFLKEWILGDPAHINPDFIARGKSLGIDITIPRRPIAFSASSEFEPMDKDSAQKMDIIAKTIRNHVKKNGEDIVFKYHGIILALLTHMEGDEMIDRLAKSIQKKIHDYYQCLLAIGIDEPFSLAVQAGQSYGRVQQALTVSQASESKTITHYKDLTIELFIDKIDNSAKEIFINKIFRGISSQKLPGWIHLLSVFYEEKGAVSDTAHRLNMHKNTLQYKIKKLIETTGYDPRVMPDAALYYLAIIFTRTTMT